MKNGPARVTRAGYAGIQRHALVWTGDNSSHWDHLNDAVQMFPTNLFAAALSYRPRGFFEAPAGHDAKPDVMARFRSHGPSARS